MRGLITVFISSLATTIFLSTVPSLADNGPYGPATINLITVDPVKFFVSLDGFDNGCNDAPPGAHYRFPVKLDDTGASNAMIATLLTARAQGLKVTIHAGDCDSPADEGGRPILYLDLNK